jgi:hypothetical protein
MIGAARLDNAMAQEFLAQTFHGLNKEVGEDLVQCYFWSRLAESNPAASTQVRLGGRLYRDSSGTKLTSDKRAQCDHRVQVWIDRYRRGTSEA